MNAHLAHLRCVEKEIFIDAVGFVIYYPSKIGFVFVFWMRGLRSYNKNKVKYIWRNKV